MGCCSIQPAQQHVKILHFGLHTGKVRVRWRGGQITVCEQPILLSKLRLDMHIGTRGKKLQDCTSAISPRSSLSLCPSSLRNQASYLRRYACMLYIHVSTYILTIITSHFDVTPPCSLLKKLVTCNLFPKKKKNPSRYSGLEDAWVVRCLLH